MYRNDGNGTFSDVTAAARLDRITYAMGANFGDLDNDGDQDICATIGGTLEGDFARNVHFENPGHGPHWITMRLHGVRSNRSAIGARITVSLDTPRGRRQVHATVSSGGSFGANSLQQEIGLGDATAIRSVVVVWPGSGAADTLTGLAFDRIYEVREGEPSARLVETKPFRLAPSRR